MHAEKKLLFKDKKFSYTVKKFSQPGYRKNVKYVQSAALF